jgi:hypothetical protein
MTPPRSRDRDRASLRYQSAVYLGLSFAELVCATKSPPGVALQGHSIVPIAVNIAACQPALSSGYVDHSIHEVKQVRIFDGNWRDAVRRAKRSVGNLEQGPEPVLDSSFAFNAQRMFSSLVHHPMPDQCHPSSQSTMLLLPPSPVLDDFLPSSPLQGLRDTTFDPFLLPSHIQETPTKHVMTLSSTFTDEDNNRNLSFLSSASTHLDLTFQLDRTITSIYVNADHANIERNIFSPATPAPNEYHQSRQQSYHQGYQRDHTQDHQKHSHSFRRTAFDLSAHECTQLSSSAFQLVSGFCSDRVPGLDYPPVDATCLSSPSQGSSSRLDPDLAKPRNQSSQCPPTSVTLVDGHAAAETSHLACRRILLCAGGSRPAAAKLYVQAASPSMGGRAAHPHSIRIIRTCR